MKQTGRTIQEVGPYINVLYRATHPVVLDDRPTIVTPLPPGAYPEKEEAENLLPLKNLVSTAVASYRADHPAVLDDRPAKVTPLPAGASRHAKSAACLSRAFCNKKRGEEKMKKKEIIYII